MSFRAIFGAFIASACLFGCAVSENKQTSDHSSNALEGKESFAKSLKIHRISRLIVYDSDRELFEVFSGFVEGQYLDDGFVQNLTLDFKSMGWGKRTYDGSREFAAFRESLDYYGFNPGDYIIHLYSPEKGIDYYAYVNGEESVSGTVTYGIVVLKHGFMYHVDTFRDMPKSAFVDLKNKKLIVSGVGGYGMLYDMTAYGTSERQGLTIYFEPGRDGVFCGIDSDSNPVLLRRFGNQGLVSLGEKGYKTIEPMDDYEYPEQAERGIFFYYRGKRVYKHHDSVDDFAGELVFDRF